MRIKSCDLTGSNGIFNGIITRFIGREIKRTAAYRVYRAVDDNTVERAARYGIYLGICVYFKSRSTRGRKRTAAYRADGAAVTYPQTVTCGTARERTAAYRVDNAAVCDPDSIAAGRSNGGVSAYCAYRASCPDTVTRNGTERGVRNGVDRSDFYFLEGLKEL